MFKGNNNIPTNTDAPDRLNRIVDGTKIEGEILCESNIRVDGVVKGTLSTKGRLFVGPKGKIEGEVTCASADIEGAIIGTIKVEELLSLKATANIQGDITTGKLSIEPGAVFAGTCSMGGVVKNIQEKSSKEADVSEEKLA